MKKNLLFFLLTVSTFFLNAQNVSNKKESFNTTTKLFSPNELSVEFDEDTILVDTLVTDSERIIEIFLTNKGTETKKIYWKVETVSFNSDWTFLICDSQNCYPPNYDHSSKNNPNILEPDSTQFWSFHFNDHAVADTGMLVLKMYDDKNFTNVVDTLPMIFRTRFHTATKDIASNSLYISPNPTPDYFSISTESDVSKLEIYNLIGKKIKSIDNNYYNFYNVSDLRNGMYLVRILDKSNKVIKVVRLNITKSRP